MSQPEDRVSKEAAPETEWQRKRRLAEVFGDVLPATTSDERDPAETRRRDDGDTWLLSQVPPHHGQ
ncbi:MAG: hypothetical protein F2667_10200 [Actinobacteria bacterium]|uniref:Unannotated protein n=1 Tax=freshwater metagenome TaxID=449393 RepID=A0A6J6R9G0_9ZZZZ|nr:hypothetical protein [Actinomycetota bacterium]